VVRSSPLLARGWRLIRAEAAALWLHDLSRRGMDLHALNR
jgi:hypothetical protein